VQCTGGRRWNGNRQAEAGAFLGALIRLTKGKAFKAQVERQETGELDLIELGHMAARPGKRAIAQKRWMERIAERAQAAAVLPDLTLKGSCYWKGLIVRGVFITRKKRNYRCP